MDRWAERRKEERPSALASEAEAGDSAFESSLSDERPHTTRVISDAGPRSPVARPGEIAEPRPEPNTERKRGWRRSRHNHGSTETGEHRHQVSLGNAHGSNEVPRPVKIITRCRWDRVEGPLPRLREHLVKILTGLDTSSPRPSPRSAEDCDGPRARQFRGVSSLRAVGAWRASARRVTTAVRRRSGIPPSSPNSRRAPSHAVVPTRCAATDSWRVPRRDRGAPAGAEHASESERVAGGDPNTTSR